MDKGTYPDEFPHFRVQPQVDLETGGLKQVKMKDLVTKQKL